MFNSSFSQNVQTEINTNCQVNDNDQLEQSRFLVQTLIQQSHYTTRLSLNDLLNSINARSAKK